MACKHNLYFSIFVVFIVMMIVWKHAEAATKKPVKGGTKARSGGGAGAAEFHLTCTVLVNGTPAGDEEADDGAEPESRHPKGKKSGKGRRKRSIRVKRAAKKVQLLCDIDNPKGQEVAQRSVKRRNSAKKAKAKTVKNYREEDQDD